MKLRDNYINLKGKVKEIALNCGRNPEDFLLLAVSKGRSLGEIRELYAAGCCDFGENRVQEAMEKMFELPDDLVWHMIGTLQKNKVNKAVGKFALIHSVDTPELAQKLSQASQDAGLKTTILLQVNTSGEPSKHGLDRNAWKRSFEQVIQLPGISVEGFMTMAPNTSDDALVRRCFASLREFKETLNQQYGLRMPHLSMGMSQDYPIAIEEGATILRIGSLLFNF